MKILECSSRGDKRFSAFYAKVEVFGKLDSIENHYQSCKRTVDNRPAKKGQKVGQIIFTIPNGPSIRLSPTYLTAYYKLLWCKYLDNNPELVKYASAYDDYNDIFKGKAINCQADVIRQYIKQGRDSILNEPDVVQLRNILSK